MSNNSIYINKELGIVEKALASKIGFDKERFIYQLMAGEGLIPEFISGCEQMIQIAYVPGETLNASKMDEQVFYHLAKWFICFQEKFHEKTGTYCVLRDPNFSNFIFAKNKIIGIDFEYWDYGDLNHAYAKLLAHIQTMRPVGCGDVEKIYDNIVDLFCESGANCQRLLCLVEDEKEKLLRKRQAKKMIERTTAAILVGGKGSRLGGVDKSKMLYKNYTFLDYIEYEMGIFNQMIYAVNDTERYLDKDKIVEDNPKGIGPAGALNALLNACSTDYLLVWSCDMPFVTEDFLVKMFCDLKEDTVGLIPMMNNRQYPLSAIYSVKIKDHIADQIDKGVTKLLRLVEGTGAANFVCELVEEALHNINTPKDYQKCCINDPLM